MTPRSLRGACVVAVACATPLLLPASLASAADPWADSVVSYVEGSGAGAYDDPTVALGEPARVTGAGIDPGAVTPFNPAWMPSEIVSVGTGGELVLRFDEPVTDDPGNPFGIDLLVFGNAFFIDTVYPFGVVGGVFSEGGAIDVSSDGVTWFTIPGVEADGLFPTLGYLDSGPYDVGPGELPSSFTRPVDPDLTMADMTGVDHVGLVAMYDGSGGGAGIDLATVGLTSIQWVRIRNTGGAALEIDAVSDVTPDLPADLNGNGTVDFGDLVLLLSAWGPCEQCPADLTSDGSVGFDDLVTLLAAFGTGG